ncbi:MAG: right-handed parallel beta-helix repeat-containing protein [Rhodothermales bacterium]
MRLPFWLLVTSILLVNTADVDAQSCVLPRNCGAGAVCVAGGVCRPVREALGQDGDRLFWVDGAAGDDRSAGTEAAPWATIGRSMQPGVLRPGDAVIVREGRYHEAIVPPAGGLPGRPIRLLAFPGDSVIVSGAMPLNGSWLREGGDWVLPWPFPPLWTRRVHDGVPQDDDARRRDVIILNGQMLKPVYRREDLYESAFYLEGSPDAPSRLFVRLPASIDANRQRWETSRLPHLFRTSDNETSCLSGTQRSYFHLIGLTFEHVANEGQQGAVCIGGEGSLLEDVTVRWTNGAGFLISGAGQTVRGAAAWYNGMTGIRGERCDRCLLEHSLSRRNNWKGYAPFWESGGGKWLYTTRSVFRYLEFSENEGPGLWLDAYNTGNTVESSRFHGNYGVNLFIELQSNDNVVRNNVMTGARYARPSFFGYGLLIHASDRNLVLHNTMMANEGGGMRIRADSRGAAVENRYDNNLFIANLRFQGLTGRDLAFENHRTLEAARSNQGDGNVFWRRRYATSSYQTFYLRLLNASGSDILSTSDLAAWQLRLQTDLHSWSLSPDAAHGLDTTDTLAGWRMREASILRGTAHPLARVETDIDGEARPADGADPGADQYGGPGPRLIAPGDASADGRLTAYDASLILRSLRGIATGPGAYDATGDGRVDAGDVVYLLKRIAAGH